MERLTNKSLRNWLRSLRSLVGSRSRNWGIVRLRNLVLVQFGQWGITTQLQNRGAVATGSSWHHSRRKKTRSFRWLMVAQLDPVATLYMKGRPSGGSLELFYYFK